MERFFDKSVATQTVSNYKKHEVIAITTDVDPSGEVTFVSQGYCPEADAKLWKDGTTMGTPEAPPRKWRDTLQEGDTVLADRGTLIQSWLETLLIMVTCIMPPFTHQGHLTEEEKIRGRAIAERRYFWFSLEFISIVTSVLCKFIVKYVNIDNNCFNS